MAEQSPTLGGSMCSRQYKSDALEQYDPHDIGAIGIAYQMHGLVIVDKQQKFT